MNIYGSFLISYFLSSSYLQIWDGLIGVHLLYMFFEKLIDAQIGWLGMDIYTNTFPRILLDDVRLDLSQLLASDVLGFSTPH